MTKSTTAAKQTKTLTLNEIKAMPDGPEKSRLLMRHCINKSKRMI
jgi:hypothetical protein